MKTKDRSIQKSRIIKITILTFVLLILNTGFIIAREKKVKEKKATPTFGILTGFVVDDEFNEPLEKAVVTIPGTLISVLTDQQGKYMLKMKGGDYFMEVNYPGYFKKQYNMSVSDGITTPMFIIKLQANAVGRTLQRKITSFENKHQFPQNLENFSTWQTAEQTGHQEFNEIFRAIPSVNFLSNGSGFNDSGIGFRGNDATHTSYTFNGILLNNPETGKVSSSMLSGMTDWAGQIQVVSGQAANLQSQTNSGGLVNVLPIAPHEKAGADILAVYGNEGFLKTSATVHSGLSKKGLASSFQISRTTGDGLVQNTAFEQYGLSLNIQKEFNQFHTLVFNANTVIQQHDRNFSDSIGAYNRYGTKYNADWGFLGKKPLSTSTNYGRSPMVSLTHDWHPRVKTHVITQGYAQFDRSTQSMPGGSENVILPRDDVGLVLFDQVTDWNKGIAVSTMGTSRLPDASGKFINSETSGISVLSNISSETRLGLRTIVTRNINKQTDFSGSINFEDYRANHFGSVNNLLGADGFTSYSDVNRAEGFPVENLFQSQFLTKYNSPDKAGYNYDSEIQTGGVSMRLNYETKRINWILAGSASMQNVLRTDYFNYLTTDPGRKTEATLLPGGHLQIGINFNFRKYHSIHLNLNYGSYQPLFTTLFPSGNNWKNEGATNEQVFDAELGYTIFSRKLKVEALAYRSQIANRSMVRYANLNADHAFGVVNDLAEVHQGVELKSSYKLTKNLQINLNGSLGDWKYDKDGQATIYDTNKEITAKNGLGIKGLKVANAPQLSLFAEAEYRWAHNFYIRLNYYRAEKIYTPLGLYDFKDLNTVDYKYKQAQIPKYDLIGFSGNYLLQLKKSLTLNLIFGGQNLLDTEYIEQSSTNIPEGSSGYSSNQVYYGMGRTWFVGMKVQF
ncbi:MAG: TonB-dependent receptor [Prolixibacteraceae bacterium]|nr:TonB-dependent receptor [Prolixibacteraceae bacterium]